MKKYFCVLLNVTIYRLINDQRLPLSSLCSTTELLRFRQREGEGFSISKWVVIIEYYYTLFWHINTFTNIDWLCTRTVRELNALLIKYVQCSPSTNAIRSVQDTTSNEPNLFSILPRCNMTDVGNIFIQLTITTSSADPLTFYQLHNISAVPLRGVTQTYHGPFVHPSILCNIEQMYIHTAATRFIS